MNRTFTLLFALVAGLISMAAAGFAQAPVPATPENTSSFIGEWTLSLEGDQGPGQFGLNLKVDAGKVVGSISMGQGDLSITDISLSGKTLVLKYNIDYQGRAIDVALSLTQAGDKVSSQMAFAGGAYTMKGTAEKKK